MKNIPIVILNRDRLKPLEKLVDSLHQRGYYNLIIIDNLSTYPPLIEYYYSNKLNVHVNDGIVVNDNSTLYRLAIEAKVPYFKSILDDWYVYTDSDVVLTEDVPENFIEDMVKVCKKYAVHKVGLGLEINNLPKDLAMTNDVVECEKQYWVNKLEDAEYDLYAAPIDTTFAVYQPGSHPLWSNHSIRMGYPYVATHEPWYYDTDNLPEDELYYVSHLSRQSGAVWSVKIKDKLNV